MSEQIVQLPGSLVTDTSYNNQPEGSHKFALNALPETTSGDKGFISSEPGNTECLNLGDYKLIGSIPLLDNQTVLFLAKEDMSNSKIAIQTNCSLQTVVETPCLNFNVVYSITGIAKVRKGCNRVIYFRDSFNSDRSIDLDEILNNPSDNRYYDGTWKCELFKLASDFTYPCLSYVSTSNTGGSLKLGVYQFAIALGDKDLNFTNVLSATQPIPIVHGQLNSNFNKIQGGDPLLETATSKSISLNISNLDQDYSYIKLYSIETVSGVTTAYEVVTLAIGGSSISYTYRGIDLNSSVVVSLNTINTPFIVYDKSKTMEQQDQRLIRGNLQSRDINHSAFQRAANLIKTRYVTKPTKYTSNTSVQSGDYYVDNRTYMRDEVYALSIAGVFNDGSISATYHIPGRSLDVDSNNNILPLNTDPSGQNGTKQHNRKDPINGWDSTEYNVVNGTTYPQVVGTNQNWNILLNTDTNTYFQLNSNEVHVEDVRPFNYNIGDSVKRWEVYNTAYQEELNSVYDTYYSKGQLAYTQSFFGYSDIEDCLGNRIYPIGNIRHHKMPDTTLEPHFINDSTNDYILSLGLEFDLTGFKAFLLSELGSSEYNQISGYIIYRAKRDKGNKSILDKGLSFRGLDFAYDFDNNPATLGDHTNYYLQCDLFNKHAQVKREGSYLDSRLRVMDFPVSYDTTTVMPDTNTFSSNRDDSDTGAFRYSYNILSHHNPQNQFNKEDSPQYIKCEKELFGKYEQWGDVNSWQSNTNSRASFWVNYNNYTGNSNYKGTPLPYFTNRQIFESTSVNPANNTVLNNIGVINATAQEVLMSYLDNFPDISNDGISYGGGPSDIGGSRDNSVTPYLDLTIPQLTSNYSKAYYNSLKIYNPAQYGQLYSLDYYPINTCLITSDVEVLFGGDCFISQITYRQTYTDDDFIDNYGDERTWWTNLITYFVESEINCKLRHESYTPDTSRWYYPYHGTTLDAIYDVMFNNDYIRAGSGSNSDVIDKYVQGDYCFNEYNYNSDYSKEQELKPNFPIALGYDYCGICSDKYPYRVVFSEKSYQEDLSDSYRRFPANNYRDLQANTGEIFNIFRQSDELYIRTENTLWFIPTKQQQLQTDQSVIQVGTGDFFSLPPKELQSVTVGYNGGQTSLDLVVNEYGAIYADVRSGIVFLLRGGQQTPISTNGNKIWFRENLSFKLLESNPSFPLTDNPTCKVGIGLIGYYDPKFKRYILTKRDYVPLYPDNSSFDEESNTWIISQDRNFIQVSNPYESPLYFENKSWTMSYYLDENKWVSWHSYLPNYAYNNRSNFYSFIYTNNYVWKHNDYNYTTFYGVKYPFIVEYINTKDPLQTKIINNISYIASTQLYDSARKQWLDYKEETFNQGIFYNDSQSTGLLDIKLKNLTDPFASVLGSFDPSEIFVERTESNWNIANIRDMVDQTSTNQAIFSSNWIDTQNKYFIDKVPNSSIINYLTKSQFEMEPMRDNYLACRFFYIPIEDKRIIVKFLENDSTFSIR